MAKTAADYIAEGRALYTNNPTEAAPLPPFPRPSSWQQRAVQQGWMDAFSEAADAHQTKCAEEAEALNEKLVDELVGGMKAKSDAGLEAEMTKDKVALLRAVGVRSVNLSSDKPGFVPALRREPVIIAAGVPQAVVAHLNSLHAIREVETDAARRSRITKKINFLVQKHSARAFRTVTTRA